jgi:predicted dinucleotide-binding enzyme
MRLGIIGSGHIGATVARLAAAAGHEVAIANTRGAASLSGLAAELGPATRADSVAGAAGFGEVVLLAIPVHAYPELPAAELAGKLVLDAGNYYPDRDGRIAELDADTTTSSELLAAQLPGATVVKAFNTLFWEHLRDRGGPDAAEPRLVVFLAGDDPAANARAADLIRSLGFAPVETGGLADGGRRQQVNGPLSGVQVTEAEAAALLA